MKTLGDTDDSVSDTDDSVRETSCQLIMRTKYIAIHKRHYFSTQSG